MEDDLRELREKAVRGMKSYLDNSGDKRYSNKDINQCENILNEFIKNLSQTPNKEKDEYILKHVKDTVIELNELNARCDFGIIETDQREILCELIILAAKQYGFSNPGIDITEKWREW